MSNMYESTKVRKYNVYDHVRVRVYCVVCTEVLSYDSTFTVALLPYIRSFVRKYESTSGSTKVILFSK